jgi:hypothetical protein
MVAAFHIGMAWTALFNFLESFVDNCNDVAAAEVPMKDFATASGRIDSVLKIPPVKQLSKLSKGGEIVISSVVDRWNQRDEEAKSRCAAIMKTDANSLLCSYAWVVGPGMGINTVEQLSPVIHSVLSSSDGWAASGFRMLNPRTGWWAN